MSHGRRWCFTSYTPEHTTGALENAPNFRGLAGQLEICPSTAREHFQGYVEFSKPIRLSGLKKICGTTHWELAKGTQLQCITYCTKDESRKENATPRIDPSLKSGGQGARNDISESARKIATGEWGRQEVADNAPELILKFSRGVNELLRMAGQKSAREQRLGLRVVILWGDAGSGKTRYAFGNGESVFILERSNSDNIWWDGYEHESTLLIDDFYGWCKHSLLLRLLDIYPCRLDVKGGSTYAAWDTVYITSNKHPREWYNKSKIWEDDQALQRRIHEIWHCKKTFFGYTWTEEKSSNVKNFDTNFVEFNSEAIDLVTLL